MCGDNKRFVAALRIIMGVFWRENCIVLLNGKNYFIDEKMYSVGKNGLKSRIRNCFKFSEVDVVTP